jgi:hypothetical protein
MHGVLRAKEEVLAGAGGGPVGPRACPDAGIVEQTCHRWCAGCSELPLPVGGRWHVLQTPGKVTAKRAIGGRSEAVIAESPAPRGGSCIFLDKPRKRGRIALRKLRRAPPMRQL